MKRIGLWLLVWFLSGFSLMGNAQFDYRDTAFVHHPERLEQAFADYIVQLKELPVDAASSSIKETMRQAAADSVMFVRLSDLFEAYLYDPESPMRDESLFIAVLEAVLEVPVLDEASKVRPAYLLELAMKNRVGEPAADFTYTLAGGKKRTLYQTEADRLLLFFHDPDCHTCRETMVQLYALAVVKLWVTERNLIVLTVYPDEDLEAWKRHLPEMPADWIHAYDAALVLKNEELYDLKSFPSLYLLDKDKRVLLKDATVGQVESALR